MDKDLGCLGIKIIPELCFVCFQQMISHGITEARIQTSIKLPCCGQWKKQLAITIKSKHAHIVVI